jgi:uncharacterized membrane protein
MAEPMSPHEAEMARATHTPHLHKPRLVVSADVAGEGLLDRIADVVNRLIGSMWLFVGITSAIVVWLFAGNIVGFDKTPWPLLLTLLNLPQLSIMISLQVSANRAQAASDARARADHATLVALHELAKRQVAKPSRQGCPGTGPDRDIDLKPCGPWRRPFSSWSSVPR